MAKKKKEKIVYYDDNSTIADMSNVTRTGKKRAPQTPKPPSSRTDKWRTYWSAVRMMLVPMFVALGILGVLFLIMMIITGNLF